MTDLVTMGWAAISWIEHYLVHGPGDVQGQPIELDDEFAAFILKAYRLDPKTGERVVRRAFLSRSKGRSKSGVAAMIECFEVIGPARFDHWAEAGEVSGWGYEYDEGEPVGAPLSYVEALNVATEEGQAGNTYDAVYFMLHPDTCSDALLEDYGRLDVGLTRIVLPDSRGFVEPVTSADTSKDGGKSTFIVADETHLWILPRLKRLHQIMVRNLLKRKAASGWMLETSTMYGEGEGSVAEGTHAYAKGLAGDAKRAGALLFDHRQASMDWDLHKRRDRLDALREAYGPAAAWMNLEAIADAWDDPQTIEAEWRRYWLNQPVPMIVGPESIMPSWSSRGGDVAMPDGLTLGLAGSIDGLHGSIGAAALDDDRLIVGAVERRAGQQWMVAEAKRIQLARGCEVVVDKRGPLAHLIPALEDEGVALTLVETSTYVDACAAFWQRVEQDGDIAHPNHPDLDAAVRVATWRAVGDRRAFGRKSGDIDMLEAVTLAGSRATADYDVLDSIY
ncbi:MAG: hypothetical protein ACO3C1_12230 [Ilumatobacteraceae bacterium]